MDDKVYELLVEDIRELKKDVKSLLQFKWQIVSGSIVVSAIVGVLIQFAIAIIGK